MSRALEQCADKLNVYSRSADSPAVVRELLSLNEEFCQCAISPEDMTAAMNNMEDGLLKASSPIFRSFSRSTILSSPTAGLTTAAC